MHDDPTLPLDTEQTVSPGLPLAREAAAAKTTWGSFNLLARVGSGGFGEVYRAWDPSLEREVALKLLLPSATGASQTDAEYTAMLREARTLAAIQHPNIVHVYGIDRHDNRVGFWTDFIKGRTLSSLIASQGPFGYREAALIALDITRALSAVHRANILHRDIKPGNVMREEGGRILLMDFGLSTIPQLQLETSISGTPSYMAPELWRGRPASVQTDIYAMGVLLFYLVTGKTPVNLSGLSASEAIAATAHPTPLLDLRSDLPESFLRTVATCLDPDPAKRFSSAGQLAAALSESLGTAAPAEITATSVSAAVAPRWRGRLTPRIAGLAAAPVLLVAIAVAAAVWQTRGMKHLVHPESTSASTSSPADLSDEYLKAQDMLRHSYLDANLAAAVSGFQAVLAKDPGNAIAYAGLGAAYFEQYRNASDPKLLDQAKASINKALQLDPNLASAHATLARMEAMAGHTDLALQQAQKAIKLDPRNSEAYAALAGVHDAQGKYADAIDSIQKAIDLAPEDSVWLVRLGSYYLEKGDSTDAAATWQKAIDLDPQNVSALYDLGVIEMRSNQFEKARSNLERVLKIQPDADSYKVLATISLLNGNYSDAIELDKKALTLNPQDHQSWASLAGAYAWSGDRADAVKSYMKAIDLAQPQSEKSPNDADLAAYLANYYASVGDTAHSLPLIRKALALSPDDDRISYIVGEGYELLGQRQMAIPLIAKALAAGEETTIFERSPEMAPLRVDPEFQAALSKAKSEKPVDTAR